MQVKNKVELILAQYSSSINDQLEDLDDFDFENYRNKKI